MKGQFAARIGISTILLLSTVVLAATEASQENPRPQDGSAVILKRLDDLELLQRRTQQQLEELKDVLLRGPVSSRAPAGPLDATVSIRQSASKGSSEAPLVMIEFSDFECSFCGRYARTTYPDIQKQFVETGKIKYVFKNFPLEGPHVMAFKAAEGAECARRQDHFWEMHDRIFADQAKLSAAGLTEHAKAIGLDGELFEQCMESGAATATVRSDQAEARRAGLTSTPTFLIGRSQPDGTVRALRSIVGAQE